MNRLIDKSKNSRGGFTVLELLVASLLLGMLMTILTMIFNQSSIAWKTGEASVKGGQVSYEKISDIRYKMDNAYMWNEEKYIHSVFDDNGDPLEDRTEYINSQFDFEKRDTSGVSVPERKLSKDKLTKGYNPSPVDCGSGSSDGSPDGVYIVNVRSWGPDRKENTRYDNIYSVSPSVNPEEW